MIRRSKELCSSISQERLRVGRYNFTVLNNFWLPTYVQSLVKIGVGHPWWFPCQRIQNLNLEPLALRRLYFDLVEVFKIIHRISDIPCHKFFDFSNNNTRGHNLKLLKKSSSCNERLFFFSNRIVDAWNSLSPESVNATSVSKFKRSLRLNLDLYQYLPEILQWD